MAEEAAAPAAAPKTTIRDWSKSRLLRTLRMFNLCNGLGLIATGILVWIVFVVNISFTAIILSTFIIFFGLLMTCLECNVGNMAPKLRRNFGFVFTFFGRALFIMFCGTLLLALSNWLGYLVGSITIVNALFNGYVIIVHPSFRSGELTATGDPFGGYTGGESEMLAYIKSNPELASKAGAAAIRVAQQNPELALQVASGARAGATAPAAPAGVPGSASNPWQ